MSDAVVHWLDVEDGNAIAACGATSGSWTASLWDVTCDLCQRIGHDIPPWGTDVSLSDSDED